MSLNNKEWKSFIRELKGLIHSAKESLPLENLFQEKEIYKEISSILNPFEIATWIMFDTEENREATTEIMSHLWGKGPNEKFLDPLYLESMFSSYFSLYKVNNKREKDLMIQNLMMKEHGFYVQKTNDFHLEEGDLFFGRVIKGEGKNYIFQVADKIDPLNAEGFLKNFFEIFYRHPLGSYSKDQLLNVFSQGYPELILMYSIAKKMSFNSQDEMYSIEVDEDEWMEIDTEELDPFMEFTYEEIGEEDQFFRLYQQFSIINERFLSDGDEEPWYNRDNIDFFLDSAAEEGIMASDEDLSSILYIMEKWVEKKYISENKDRKPKFKNSIMLYKKALSQSYRGFYCDPFLKDSVKEKFKEESFHLRFFQGFEKFMDYIMVNTIHLTPAERLKMEDLDEIVSYCNLTMIRSVKRPDERHYPILSLWKRFAFVKNFLEIQGKEVGITESYDFYLRMDIEEKISLWITSITNKNFLIEVYKKEDSLIISSGEEFYKDLVKYLEEICIKPVHFQDLKSEKEIFFFEVFYALNLIDLKLGRSDFYSITSLGGQVASFLGIKTNGVDKKPLTFPKNSNES